MKLPSSLRKFRKLSLYLASYLLLIIVMMAPVPQIYAAGNPMNYRSVPGSISLESGDIITEIIISDPSVKMDVRPEEVSSPYSPISSISGAGDSFTINDNFLYEESHTEDLDNKYTGIQINDYIQANYTVEDLGYSDDYYSYNISSITALKDFYEIESYTSRSVNRLIGYSDFRIVAQGFEVKWDYANFTQARLWLQENIVFNDQIEIFLCPIGSDNYPNATNVLSTAGTYTGSTLASTSIIDGVQILPTYTFSEVTLSKGTYFIVVNHTYVDQLNSVYWWGNNTTPNTGLSYRSLDNNNGTGVSWGGNVWDFTLEVELLPVNSTYDGALAFSDPEIINLRDNSTTIDSNYFTIQSNFIGFHYLVSNTSVSVNFDTIYYFSTTYSASSVYSITNSTFDSMTCDWNITWSTSQISTTYTMLDRNMSLVIPADWTDTFDWNYNLTNQPSFEKLGRTYIIYLNTTTSPGDWWIDTTSPNHIYSTTFSDGISETDRYVLGYWTTDTVDAFGYNGSTIYLDAIVRGDDGAVYNDTTGALNYTLFDPNGQIIPLKTSLDVNLTYVDTTSYSLDSLSFVSDGYISSSITFDPSVYGSDLAGFWTAMVYWENGTEVGFYTQRIIVQTNTTFICEWEIEPGSNTWTTSDLTREQFDDVDLRASYYNISEPFFVGAGKSIPSADVTYTPSWKAGGTFTDSQPDYTATVNADSAVGIHTIDILASGAFLINHTASFDVTVFYKLSFDILNSYYNANYTNNAYFYFALTDESAGSNLTDIAPGSPDDITVIVDNVTDNFVLSSPADYGFTYTGASELWELDISTSTNDLAVGLYNVFITVQYDDYRANYTDEYVSDVFILEVSAPKTVIQMNSWDTTIYTYHSAFFNFDFHDTNHSLDLTGAAVDVWFNVTSDVSAIVTPIGNSYQAEVTSNNPSVTRIEVYINVTLPNYVPINNYLLGTLDVIIIQTDITTIDVPPDMFDGYNTSVIIQFNDLDNTETIDGAYLESIITNSTSFVNVSIVAMGGGQYNITFINYDVAVFWLDMNITLAKPGYDSAVIRITIKVIVVQTDSLLLDSSSVSIYYNTGTTFDILYWDNVSMVNITSPGVSFSGNLTGVVTPVDSFLNNITTITVGLITTLGYWELIITIIEPGYQPQIITVYILVQERQTSIDSDFTNITFYADLTDQVLLNYTDELDSTEVLLASVNIDFAVVNSTLSVSDYFIVNWIEVGSLYEVTFDPIEINATGFVFLFNLTISRYGYETRFIIITVTITIHPTAIDASSENLDTVYTDGTGNFTIIYETAEDTFISGADLTYVLINGTAEDILNVALSQVLSTYVVDVFINSSIEPITSFLIELTFYKHGYENQTWIITITVIFHPTAIDASSQDQDSVYIDGDGAFTVIYETVEDTFIGGAELIYNLINGTAEDIQDVILTQIIDAYVVYVYINSSIEPVKSFLIELTFYKHGYENQTWIITITVIVHPTAIDPTSDSQHIINTDENGVFTVIYETIEDTFISGAELTYVLINGTSSEILDVALSQVLSTYVVDVTINSSIVPVTSFLIELTFYKHGYENQTWIVTLIISIHPSDIDSSSEDQTTIYADEVGEFIVIYETEEGDFIAGAEIDYSIISGSTAEILSVILTEGTTNYLIQVNFDATLIAGKNFSIELIFFRHGYENQTWIINIEVHEKITYEISVEIVGEMRQLGTIQFRVSIDNFNMALLSVMSFDNIKFYTTPDGDFVVITYVFTFANGTTKEYSIQASFVQIEPGHYVALTSEILVPWRVTSVSYLASYTPTSQSVLSIEESSTVSADMDSAQFLDLITYLFSEYTPYMAAALAVIAIIFISLTIHFAVVRPRRQRRKAKKRGYLDKISKILTSVISMRKVIVVHNETGLPLYEWDLGGVITVDSSLVSGFLQAVSGMGGEISGGEAQAVRKIDYGQFCVFSSGTDCITTYLFSTSEVSKDVEQGLAKFVTWFEKKFHAVVSTTWDGKTDEFTDNARAIIDTLSEDLFIWTLHPLTVNVVKEKEVPKLDQLSQKIFKFIKDYKEVSISVALEYFNKSPIEETLTKLFELVDNTFLLRKRLR